jgi:amino acid transporter, AAT family
MLKPSSVVQTYSVVVPKFVLVDFISLYLQVPVFLTFYFGWKIWHRSSVVDLRKVDLEEDQYRPDSETRAQLDREEEQRQAKLSSSQGWRWRLYYWLV